MFAFIEKFHVKNHRFEQQRAMMTDDDDYVYQQCIVCFVFVLIFIVLFQIFFYKGNYKKFVGLKKYNNQLKTMIAIGGWNEGSKRFSKLVANNDLRSNFIKSVLKFLREHNFDGIDFDWV